MSAVGSAGGLYQREDSPFWWFAYYVEGKRKRVNTKCRDKRAAEAVARELERAAADPSRAAQDAATLGAYLQRHLEHLSTVKERAAETIEFYRKKSGHLVRLLGAETALAKIDALVVDRYITARRAEGAVQNTISKELTALRGALKLARRDRAYPYELDEVMPVGFAPEYTPRETFLTRAQADALLAALAPLRRAHVAYILGTGARLEESCRATRGDLEKLDEGRVFVRGSKTRKAREHGWLPVVGHAEEMLRMVRTSVGPGPRDELMFPPWGNITRDLAVACKRAGVPRVTANDLRRTYATWFRMAGVSYENVGELLRHTDPRMAKQVYAKMTPEALGEIVQRQMGESPPASGRRRTG